MNIMYTLLGYNLVDFGFEVYFGLPVEFYNGIVAFSAKDSLTSETYDKTKGLQ